MELWHGKRKLAVIVAADVAGYSRLMGADEDGTLAQLKEHRRALVDPKIKEHRGTIIKTTGDGLLVEFSTVVDALRCAVEVQRGMAERNAGVPAHKRIEFRIGINLGDIIHDQKDIFGDGVNIAARLEGIAEPGGICISRSVRDLVLDKLGFTFEDIGDQALKNIAAPIQAYRVRFGERPKESKPTVLSSPHIGARLFPWVLALAAGCAVVLVALAVWPKHPVAPTSNQPAVLAQSTPLPLPDKPSIAVLPFKNIGGDDKLERLADGITDDVITDLSRYRDLFVIASNSVFTYKGKAVSVKQVGRDLGVRYVLEGSIQTSGGHARVTAQLIEAASDSHVWSGRYDRVVDDIFDIQNEVTQKIAGTLGGIGILTRTDAANARRKPPANLQAYDYYVLGQELHYKLNKEDVNKAEGLLNKAIELDPQFARAYFALGHLYNTYANFGWADPDASFDKAQAALAKAISLDPTDADPHAVLGNVYCSKNEFDRCFAEFEQAYSLNPNDPSVLMHYGGWLFLKGRAGAQEGIDMIHRAIRLNPHHPPWYNGFNDPFYVAGQYDELIARTHRRGEVSLWGQITMSMSYAQLGRQTDAAVWRDRLLQKYPEFSLERAFSDFGGIPDEPTREHYLDGARKAGLRECATDAELQKYPKMTHLATCDARRAAN